MLKTDSTSNNISNKPAFRKLRGNAFDPSLSLNVDTAFINNIVYKIPWEDILEKGPSGEYLEVIDYDPTVQKFYTPVDLNAPYLLAQDGLPFDDHYTTKDSIKDSIIDSISSKKYSDLIAQWRNIDDDWLFSAGSLALRINNLTNNLSLALCIEFEDSKRVMLFPGDAEYGSWSSWHKINWNAPSTVQGKHLTEDLLNRTVFYKVAHHMSHNGTAQRLGMKMMNHKDLAAMATLDYSVINDTWKNTMPNRELLQELLDHTKGRLMIMNETNLFFDFNMNEPLADKIKDARRKMTTKETADFKKWFKRDPDGLFIQYTVKA